MTTLAYKQFKPAWWLRNAHLQTLWPLLFKQKLPAMQACTVELPDGDFIETSHVFHDSDQHVVIFHGLEGSIYSHYARRIINTLNNNKIAFTFIHFRGCGTQPNRNDCSYHSGHTNDIDFVVRQVKKQHSGKKIIAIGYSLGGNALLKYLGEPESQALAENVSTPTNLVDKAIAVSPPMQLNECATRLDQGFSRVYTRHLLSSLKRKILTKYANSKTTPVDIAAVKCCTSFWQFDELVTARLNGFENVHHYYAESSAKQYLSKIKTPTLILQAKDDPFLTPAVVPEAEELSPSVQYELSPHGGHVGFVAGRLPGFAEYWLEKRMLAYIGSGNKPTDNKTRR